jgi:hypothetical protein
MYVKYLSLSVWNCSLAVPCYDGLQTRDEVHQNIILINFKVNLKDCLMVLEIQSGSQYTYNILNVFVKAKKSFYRLIELC